MENNYWRYMDRMDAAGLRELMDAYGQDVWNLAYVITRRHDLADDIAQDVFLKVYQSIGAFRGASSIRTWLLALTRNTAINYKRTAFMRRVLLVGRTAAHEGKSPSAEQEAMEQELTSEIWSAVLELPVKLREVLVLHARYEMTTKEIADALELPEGTVKTRLSRARKRMSSKWKESAAYE
ncbi:RNA polymerase sigma-70 factor, ECF subfamily [Paenibacillus catalpae]|uniref:RNA polymerase sigma-70 factor, ECF subfamily n=1 Tax=Paenibacillus catalpae TaxID=1045775 RepID=A0A1I1X427_9BACL|nr:sigma-70 family RNA polymerase sigma factor [Paenibacillus catalpae]SFE00433.1 RNA polymerase sigma-70 factor, ECF subfamily [Paenibacillus catalpae]